MAANIVKRVAGSPGKFVPRGSRSEHVKVAQTYESSRTYGNTLVYRAAHRALLEICCNHGPVRADGWIYSHDGAGDINRMRAR